MLVDFLRISCLLVLLYTILFDELVGIIHVPQVLSLCFKVLNLYE